MEDPSKCYYIETITPKNTVLLVEPRRIMYVITILKNAFDVLGDKWNYVFYCGKSVYDEWCSILPSFIEIRALQCDNLTADEYNSFFKTTKLWSSLYGKFILTIQLDSWLLNEYPYTIDYFLKLDKSFIGGGMSSRWEVFADHGIYLPFNNLNGGLSLRKREDMITVIDYFSSMNDEGINSLPEDVYLSLGCYKLNKKIGDDEPSFHFALHKVYCDKSFGIHKLCLPPIQEQFWKRYPTLVYTNPYVFVYVYPESMKYKQNVYNNVVDFSSPVIWQPYVGNVASYCLLK